MEEIFWICSFIMGLVFLNPIILALIGGGVQGFGEIETTHFEPSVSCVTVARHPDEIFQWLKTIFDQNYPPHKIEVIVYFDGAQDLSNLRQKFPSIKFYCSQEREGKNQALNSAFEHCTHEIIVYSDADVMFYPDSLQNLVKHFGDENVGGVCGKIELIRDSDGFKKAQSRYFGFDRWIKVLECRRGSISTNTGALYAMHRKLFSSIPLTVTDDLFICLMINRKGYRFVYEPLAIVKMQACSKNARDEIRRRRRIVCRSLTGLWMMRSMLNPLKYGLFSISLFLNKVVRRFLPIVLLFLLSSNLLLYGKHLFYDAAFLLQLIFYLSGFIYFIFSKKIIFSDFTQKWMSVAFYFILGNWGTFLGLLDFVRGRRVIRW